MIELALCCSGLLEKLGNGLKIDERFDEEKKEYSVIWEKTDKYACERDVYFCPDCGKKIENPIYIERF